MLFDFGGTGLQPIGRNHLVRHFKEGLREESLTPVDVDDALVENHVGRGGSDRRLRNALGRCLAFKVGQPAFEAAGISAVFLGVRRRGGGSQQKKSDPETQSYW